MMETAMSDGKGNGVSDVWRRRDRDGGGDGSRRPQQWPMAAATAMGNCDGDGDGDGNGVGVGDGDGDGKGDGHGKGDHEGRVASSCGGNVQRFWTGDTLPPPTWTWGKFIHQHCIMGVTLQRVFAPLQGGRFLTAHHGLFLFIIYNYCSVYWTTLCLPPRIIQALKNPPVSPLMLYLLHSSKNPVSLFMIYPGSYCTFCQGKPGQGMQW
jgi:hypothetical protein